jgi:hypothetical protein
MRWLAVCALVAGCHFGIPAVDVEMGAGEDLGELPDANIELGMAPPDANLFDFSLPAVDLARKVPDGATPRQPGYPCADANECDNGLCIDGFCCNELCDPFDPANKCRACNVPGSEGYCSFAQDNSDPRGLCDESAAGTCGQDGLCDGKGGCRLRSIGSFCGAGACSAGQVTAPPVCDGAGNCNPGTVMGDCFPYACNAAQTGCATSCTLPATGCALGATCDAFGVCNQTQGLGAPCGVPTDCESGFCSQGVCCETDCSGDCRSCALPGAKGLCLPVAAGSDPYNQCATESRASCGHDGDCDGSGACRFWSNTTTCASRTCNGDFTIAPRFCDGAGVCLAGAQTSCNPYTCELATGVCYGQPCGSNANCAAGAKCHPNGKCGPP